jgi:hypothetical protein
VSVFARRSGEAGLWRGGQRERIIQPTVSILVVHLVQQGLLFGADRNVTTQVGTDVVYVGQAQRPKVLKWPNRDAIIGYVGQAMVGDQMTDEWLYAYIGRNLGDVTFEELATALANDLDEALADGEITSALVIHLGGFEIVDGRWHPRVWFLHNTAGLTDTGAYLLGTEFVHREELAQPSYFGGRTADEIRAHVATRIFSYRQGYDLPAFNLIDEGLREAMRLIVHHHPGSPVPVPTTLDDWEKHVRLSILGYGAYFGAFYQPFEQYVGGGADVVSVPWP